MTPEQIVGKTVDHIFDVEGEDGTVTQVAYTGVVTRIVEKNESNPKETLFEIVYDSTIKMKTVMVIDNQMKKIPLNMHCFRILLKEI